MSKKMNLGNLKTIESKTFTTRKVIVDKYEVNVDEVFRESKIQSMLKEFMEKYNYAKDNDIELDATTYVSVLIIKHFTDIEFPDDLMGQYQLLNILLDLGYLEPINNAFSESEIKKLNDKMIEYANNINKLIDELKEKELAESEAIEEVVETE